jgi:hypothetical protein
MSAQAAFPRIWEKFVRKEKIAAKTAVGSHFPPKRGEKGQTTLLQYNRNWKAVLMEQRCGARFPRCVQKREPFCSLSSTLHSVLTYWETFLLLVLAAGWCSSSDKKKRE